MATDESLSLSIQQKLRQRLSPVQVRFGQMLEMSAPELEDELRRMLDDNPALEVVENSDDSPADDFSESATSDQPITFIVLANCSEIS